MRKSAQGWVNDLLRFLPSLLRNPLYQMLALRGLIIHLQEANVFPTYTLHGTEYPEIWGAQ